MDRNTRGLRLMTRTFGESRCLPCKIGKYPCGIVVPVRSHYPEDIIRNFVSPVALREALRDKGCRYSNRGDFT